MGLTRLRGLPADKTANVMSSMAIDSTSAYRTTRRTARLTGGKLALRGRQKHV